MTDILEMSSNKFLLIINEAPYGIERPYYALRLALNLSKREGVLVSVFLVGDGMACVRKGQNLPRDITI